MKPNFDYLDTIVANHLKAVELSEWNGRGATPYFQACRQQQTFRGITSIFTRDVGYHSSGWWKNPDYERCLHLSLSFFDPVTFEPCCRDRTITGKFISLLFGVHRRWLWCEPPYSAEGKRQDVWHYRLFCDPAWNPIKPRGEVYSRELTEAGWLSFSDLNEKLRKFDRKKRV